MKKVLSVGLVLAILTGCGQQHVEVDTDVLKFKEVCHDSVVYLVGSLHQTKGYGFMSVKLDTEGRVEVCNKWKD